VQIQNQIDSMLSLMWIVDADRAVCFLDVC